MLAFRKRTFTEWLAIVKKPLKGATKETLLSEARRLGEFDTGYHFIIHNDGSIEADRDIEAVAQWDFKDNATSIYVLCDTDGSLTDSQRIAVSDLFKELVKTYPHLQTTQEG